MPKPFGASLIKEEDGQASDYKQTEFDAQEDTAELVAHVHDQDHLPAKAPIKALRTTALPDKASSSPRSSPFFGLSMSLNTQLRTPKLDKDPLVAKTES